MASGNAEAIKRMLNSHENHSRAPYLRKDHGLEMLKIEEGLMRMDILGWTVKKQKDVKRTTTTMDVGSLAPWRYFQLHKDVGPSRDRVVCPARTYGKPCPICEESNKAYRAGADKAVLETFYASARRLWACRVEDQLYLGDTSDHNVGKAIEAWLKSDLDRNASFHFHKGAEGGRTLKVLFAAEKANIGGKSVNMFKAANVSSTPRKDIIPAAMLKEIPDLDTLLVEHTYEELRDMWHSSATASDADDDEESPRASTKGKKTSVAVSGGKKKKPRDEEEDDDEEDEELPFDEDEDLDEDEEGEEDEEDEEDEDLDEDEEEALDDDEDEDEEDEEDEDPKPAKRGSKAKPAPKKQTRDDEDEDEEEDEDLDEDEDEDEEVVTKPARRSPKGKAKPAARKEGDDPEPDEDEDEEPVQRAPKGKAKPAKPAAAGKAKPGKPLAGKKPKWPPSK